MTALRWYAPVECTGKDGYPPEWHESIKHDVRAAAGNRCVRCSHPYERGAGEWSPCDEMCTHDGPLRYQRTDYPGWKECGPEPVLGEPGWNLAMLLKHGWEVEARWRILTVHHLDGDKGNCRWWNLVALCQRCHLEIQGKVRMERRWQREHSEWFKPYVAGYYAFTFLGEDLTREQVDARLDELLALEDRQLALGLDAA